jgi:hypothetical protein
VLVVLPAVLLLAERRRAPAGFSSPRGRRAAAAIAP